jgi:hypothetical protein
MWLLQEYQNNSKDYVDFMPSSCRWHMVTTAGSLCSMVCTCMWVCIELGDFLQNIRTIPEILLTLSHAYLCWEQPAVTLAASVFQYNCGLCIYGSIENDNDLVSSLLSTI